MHNTEDAYRKGMNELKIVYIVRFKYFFVIFMHIASAESFATNGNIFLHIR